MKKGILIVCLLLFALAAGSACADVIISEVMFGRLFRNFALKLAGVAIGAVIYYIVIQVVLWLGLNTNLLKLLSALIVAVFLAVPHWQAQAAQRGGRNHA